MLYHGLRLGAVSHRLAPLYAYWKPHLKLWLLLPAAVLAVYLIALRRTRSATSLSTPAAIGLFTAASIAISAAVSFGDSGPRSIVAPLQRTDLEYSGAVDRVGNVAEFLRDYPRLADSMPMHAQVHPPGPIVFLWAASRLFGDGPWGGAAAIILFSSIAVPIVYRWAHRLHGPGAARRAAALFVVMPSVVLFTATSMDGPFAVLLIATMASYWESIDRRPILLGAVAGVAAGLAALMTYSVAVALVFCGVAALVRFAAEPATRRNVVLSAAAAALSFPAAQALLWLGTGYDPIQTFLAALGNHHEIMAGTRHETAWRYANLAVANLAVFSIAVGIPCSVLFGAAIAQSFRNFRLQLRAKPQPIGNRVPADPLNPRSVAGDCLVVSGVITLAIAALAPVYVLEVERIWMFLVPLVAIPVSSRLFEYDRGTGRTQATLATISLVALQTFVTEILLTTYW